MQSRTFRGRDFLRLLDFTKEEIETILDVAFDLKRKFALGESHRLLQDKTLFMIFFNQSLRTRNSFEAGMTQLGGHAHYLDPLKIYTPARAGEEKAYSTERISDIARTLSRMGHGISMRMYGDPAGWIYGKARAIMKEFAEYSDIPFINMECDKYHPCQGMADIMTVKEKFGTFKGVKFVMSWAYSESTHKPLAVPQSAVIAATMVGCDVIQAQPEGFELDPEVIKACEINARRAGGSFKVMHNMEEAFKGAHVIYPKCWGALDYFAKTNEKGEITKPVDHDSMKVLFDKNRHWICDREKLELIDPEGVYMHCLPADRGQEVTDEVIDGPRSVVFDEAENRLHVQKAVMSLVM